MRKIKTIRATYEDVKTGKSDIEVNKALKELTQGHHKIITIQINNFGINPMLLLYTIIYEEIQK